MNGDIEWLLRSSAIDRTLTQVTRGNAAAGAMALAPRFRALTSCFCSASYSASGASSSLA